MAVLAVHQAERGRNVLVVDLDLEAPGIGAVLLAREDLPQLGVLDWLPDQLTSEFADRAFGSFLTRADRLIVDSSG